MVLDYWVCGRELLMALRFLLRQKSVVEMYERAIAVRARELVDPDDPLALEHVRPAAALFYILYQISPNVLFILFFLNPIVSIWILQR